MLVLCVYVLKLLSGFSWWKEVGNIACRRFAACDCWAQTS